MVPPARLELARPKSTDFESVVFTDFTTGAQCEYSKKNEDIRQLLNSYLCHDARRTLEDLY